MIPDISGFTQFVNDTEIKHGVHIIAELLEAIIESNTMNLDISEIEGDAIFYYRTGEKPVATEVNAQIEAMYNAFYTQIQRNQRDRICSCGACTTVHNLKLKFVSHYGKIIKRTIANYTQLMGSDVTFVHKLLKNNIDSSEYFLWSDNSIIDSNKTPLPWKNPFLGCTEYDGFGSINYRYIPLQEMAENVPPPKPRRLFEPEENPPTISITINANFKKVYKLLTDLELKHIWVKGVKEITFNKKEVSRIGSTHNCVVPLGSILFETIENKEIASKMVYTEYAEGLFFIPPYFEKYTVNKINDQQSKLVLSLHFKGGTIKNLIAKTLMPLIFKKNIIRFKKLCEN